MAAAAHPVPAAGGSDASAHFCVTSGWRSRCTSQRPSTTALVRRWSQWRRCARRRWRLKLCTTLHGDRSSLHRRCGRAVFPTPGRRSRWQPRSVTWLPGRDASLQSSWCRTRPLTTRPLPGCSNARWRSGSRKRRGRWRRQC